MNAHRNTRSLSHAERSLLTLLFAAIVLALVFTPNTRAQDAAPSVVAAQYFDAIHGNASSELTDPEAVLHTPEGEYTGVGAVSEFGATLVGSFSNLEFQEQSVESVDNLMVIAFTMTGINTGSYHGVKANCAGIAVPGVAYVQLGDAGVVEQWIDYDGDTVANQIAAVNLLDPDDRPGCAGQVQAQAVPTYEAPPSCLSANECETAW
ncbi:MAG: ester cyclase [Chloroflexia bacterium]|nr:ester cyclase [Chloroflexia bacterium]